MGAVYQAEHTHMRKRLAVKVLHPEMSRLPEVVARFEREAMAAAHIEHPNVARRPTSASSRTARSFSCSSTSRARACARRSPKGGLELGRALHITRQIASALARAHALGIVHRDLKPENVMLVERDGDPDFVKVLDFGIAKVPDRRARWASTSKSRAGAHAARDGLRHARVHGARAGARAAGRRARGPLRARRDGLRDAHGHAPVRPREQGHAPRDARDGADPEHGRATPRAPTSRPRSRRSSGASSRRRRRALRRRAGAHRGARRGQRAAGRRAGASPSCSRRRRTAHRPSFAAFGLEGTPSARPFALGPTSLAERTPARIGLALAVARRCVARRCAHVRAAWMTPSLIVRRWRVGCWRRRGASAARRDGRRRSRPGRLAGLGGCGRSRRAAAAAAGSQGRRGRGGRAGQDRQGRLRDGDRRADGRREERPRPRRRPRAARARVHRRAQHARARCARPGSGSRPIRRGGRRSQARRRTCATPRSSRTRRTTRSRCSRRRWALRGIDILYDIAYGASGRLYPQAATRARNVARLVRRPRPREPRAQRPARLPRRQDLRPEARAPRRAPATGRRSHACP